MKVYEGLSFPRERDALQLSLFRLTFTSWDVTEVLFLKNVPKLGTIQKPFRGTMEIFRPTDMVAKDIHNAKLAIKLGKQWALLGTAFDLVGQLIRKVVWKLIYTGGQR